MQGQLQNELAVTTARPDDNRVIQSIPWLSLHWRRVSLEWCEVRYAVSKNSARVWKTDVLCPQGIPQCPDAALISNSARHHPRSASRRLRQGLLKPAGLAPVCIDDQRVVLDVCLATPLSRSSPARAGPPCCGTTSSSPNDLDLGILSHSQGRGRLSGSLLSQTSASLFGSGAGLLCS